MALDLEPNHPDASSCAPAPAPPHGRRSRRWRRVAPVVAVVAVSLACAACFPQPGGGTQAGDALTAMNQDRAAAGLGPLAWDSNLASIAQSHANDISFTRSLWHSDLAWLIAQPSMAGTWSLGENLLQAPAGYNGYALEDLWMGSPPHRANILNGGFNRVGIGTVVDGSGQVWMVALFGAR